MLRSVTAALLLLCTACATDSPSAPLEDASATSSPGRFGALTYPRTYLFSGEAGNDQARAWLDGTRSVRCTDSDAGAYIFRLTLTDRMAGELVDAVTNGGTATIEVKTQNRFVGVGTYNYNEQVTMIAGGSAVGTFADSDTQVHPGPVFVVTDNVFAQQIPLGTALSLATGSVLEVVATGTVTADLGSDCGEIKGGEGRWKTWSAKLLLVP